MVIPDGYTSASILYLYLKKSFPDINLSYILHNKSKSHGLSDIDVSHETNLIILVDAGTNDIKECKELKDRGIDVICIDHHISELKTENIFAIVVNNQISENYKNKQLSAAGLGWQFCRALDDELWQNYADNYLDLVALGNIADSMDIRSYETRRLIDKGLSSIKNKLFLSLLDKISYSTNNEITIVNMQFYAVPTLNGLLRIGSLEERDILFRAFIETDEEFDYQKNSKSETVKENIYNRASRLAINAKSRQNRELDKSLEILNINIVKYKFDKNKILFVNAGDLDYSLTGLSAMKLASQYNRPCIVLRKNKNGYGGSGRNLDSCGLDNLKDFLFNTGYFEYCNGHPGAFGIQIKEENLRPAIEKVNELLKDFSFEKIWNIDFIFNQEDITIELVKEFDRLKNCYGMGVNESINLVKSIKINSNDIQLIGENKNTWKFLTNNQECVIIKFKADENDEILKIKKDNWAGEDLILNMIGKFSISNFQNILTSQFIVSEYECKIIKEN
jgi:single-stranded-DNA-specific exonuclease